MEKLSDLFANDIENLKIEVIKKRLIQASLSLGAVCMVGSAALAPNQPKPFLLWQLGLSSIFGLAGAYVSHAREDVENRYSSYLNLNREKAKKVVGHTFDFDLKLAKISSDLNIAREVRRLPPPAQQRYAEEMGLQGLILSAQPPQQQEVETGFATVEVTASKNVDKTKSESSKRNIDKDKDAILKHLANQYPQYFKYNGQWIVDIAKSSMNPDMSARQNHHLYFCGKSQSGKTTLASVFINLMSEFSELPIKSYCHDAKAIDGGVDISNWLCEFTEEPIKGFEATEGWYKHSNEIVQAHFQEVGRVGYSGLDSVSDLIMVQDEIDTIYGKGDGYGEIVDKKLAKKLQSSWLSWTKVLKGCKGHFVAMGQSPLTTENGFSRPTLGEFCFICINKSTAKYILNSPKDFLDDPTEEELEFFTKTVDFLDSAGVRFALVRPTIGKCFIGIIPHFKKAEDEIETSVNDETGFTTEDEIINDIDDELLPERGEIEGQLEDKFYGVEDNETSEDNETGFTMQYYEDYMVTWLRNCLTEFGKLPSDETIKTVWAEQTGVEITSQIILQGLIETLMKKLQAK